MYHILWCKTAKYTADGYSANTPFRGRAQTVALVSEARTRDLRDRAAAPMQFRTPMLYGLVRHPIMLGFIIAFWAAPNMSRGHLLFAAATTIYILAALQFEEADLMAAFGTKYADYRERVPMLAPFIRRRSAPASRVSTQR
jgi:protein-S-isoprenylcysteine O-methyltransferase Ste14